MTSSAYVFDLGGTLLRVEDDEIFSMTLAPWKFYRA
jgi:FMN phosphatase YigB (HAD superfamily)